MSRIRHWRQRRRLPLDRVFLDIVSRSRGVVLVRCDAGAGRTGAMVAAYLVATAVEARRTVREYFIPERL
jgi:protein tyrosine phosphatase